jgi:sporulation protein YtfJ
MSENPIQGIMGTVMQKVREMVDVNTIIGEPITAPDGTTIIPVSKVTFGFASGGSDFPAKNPDNLMFGGGGGAGVTITPIAFLVVNNGDVKMLQIYKNANSTDKVIAMVPELFDKIAGLFNNKKSKNDIEDTTEE